MTEPDLCAHCAAPITAPRGARGPKPKYCSAACRQAAHRARVGGPAAVSNLMADLSETFQPIAEAAVGMRKGLEEEHGYSPTMAEMIAGQYHAAMVKGMAEFLFAAQIKLLRK